MSWLVVVVFSWTVDHWRHWLCIFQNAQYLECSWFCDLDTELLFPLFSDHRVNIKSFTTQNVSLKGRGTNKEIVCNDDDLHYSTAVL